MRAHRLLILAIGIVLTLPHFAIGQLYIAPGMPPEESPWPARFVGCRELVTFGICYSNQSSTGPVSIAGWGADVEPVPMDFIEASSNPIWAGAGAVAPFVSVNKTRDRYWYMNNLNVELGPDGDKAAGLAWPEPVVVMGGGTKVLGFVKLARPDTAVSGGRVDVLLKITAGDTTEGVITSEGITLPFDFYNLPRTRIQFVNIYRSPADIAGPGQQVGPDGFYSADDIIVFYNLFFSGHPLADVAGPGQSPVPDGDFTADDIIVFLNWYSAGTIGDACYDDSGNPIACPCQ
jgi:hypothetical protein